MPSPFQVCAAEGRNVAVMLDLEGSVVRSSFLIDQDSRLRVAKIELQVRAGCVACHGLACRSS